MSSKPVKYTSFEPGSLLRAVAFCNPTGRIRLDDVPEIEIREQSIMREIEETVISKELTPQLVEWVRQTLRYLGNKLVFLGYCRTAPVPFVSFDQKPYGAEVRVRWREVGAIP